MALRSLFPGVAVVTGAGGTGTPLDCVNPDRHSRTTNIS